MTLTPSPGSNGAYSSTHSYRRHALLSFAFPFLVRTIPEVMMADYIVGFDTLCYYLPVAWDWLNNGIEFWAFFGYAPLFYLVLYCLSVIGVPLFVSLKVLPPLVHGLLGLAVFLFSTKVLGWMPNKSLLSSLIATLYFVGLRISWDMLRSELALVFIFPFFIVLDGVYKGKNTVSPPSDLPASSHFRCRQYLTLSVLMVLTALSHQLVSILMFITFLGYVVKNFVRGNRPSCAALVLTAIPAGCIFALTAYADYAVLTCYFEEAAGGMGSEWLSLFTGDSPVAYTLVIVGFFFFCYLPLLPFAILGSQGALHTGLRAWLLACLIGTAASLVSSGVPLGYRWILLANFPYAYLVAEGLLGSRLKPLKKPLAGLAVALSVSFVLLPHGMALPYFSMYPYYFPSSMLQNSVPLRDCPGVVDALEWVRLNLGNGGVLLVHDAFSGWSLLYAPDVVTFNYGYSNPEDVAVWLSNEGYDRIFVVWWIPGEGWHGQESLSGSFKEVYRTGMISVYEFKGVA
ncbi:MAG: hypothetical protein QFX35_05910 [Candidatus Verstraetearchaeota archaeon]|nr:hypothetical protein [Candidatus Verstraetearchaeota archaeon]